MTTYLQLSVHSNSGGFKEAKVTVPNFDHHYEYSYRVNPPCFTMEWSAPLTSKQNVRKGLGKWPALQLQQC